MNSHVPCKNRNINDTTIFEERKIHTVLSTLFEDYSSDPTQMHLSQLIKNPPPSESSEIIIFSVLISWCRIFASKYDQNILYHVLQSGIWAC